MPNINTGSITQFLIDSISPMPTSVSGVLTNIVNNQRYFVEQFTGDSVGDVIAEKYQSPITDLSIANVISMIAVQDLGVDSVKIGELTTSNKNLLSTSEQLREKAIFELKSLSKGIKFFKARG